MYPRGWCDPPGWSRNVAFQDHYAYVASEEGGLEIIDVQNPDTLVELGLFLTPNTQGIAVWDYRAFLADLDSGLYVVDVSDPNTPFKLAHLPLTGCTNLALSGDRLIITTATGIVLMDVHMPEAPVVTATFALPGQPKDVAFVDDLVFVADDVYGLRVLCILSATSIVEVGHYRFGGDWCARGVAAVGNHVYVAYGSRLCAFEYMRPTMVNEPAVPAAREIELLSCYPNPFNATTIIRFMLSRSGPAVVRVYDMNGRMVSRLAQGSSSSGEHALMFDGRGLASGAYLCRLEAGGMALTTKMVLVK